LLVLAFATPESAGMLFLLRPRQTWMPYALPRSREQQDAYNRQLHDAYGSTRRVDPSAAGGDQASAAPLEGLKELASLHKSGALTDDEFATAKAKILGPHRP
jgi:hypothetical protein